MSLRSTSPATSRFGDNVKPSALRPLGAPALIARRRYSRWLQRTLLAGRAENFKGACVVALLNFSSHRRDLVLSTYALAVNQSLSIKSRRKMSAVCRRFVGSTRAAACRAAPTAGRLASAENAAVGGAEAQVYFSITSRSTSWMSSSWATILRKCSVDQHQSALPSRGGDLMRLPLPRTEKLWRSAIQNSARGNQEAPDERLPSASEGLGVALESLNPIVLPRGNRDIVICDGRNSQSALVKLAQAMAWREAARQRRGPCPRS